MAWFGALLAFAGVLILTLGVFGIRGRIAVLSRGGWSACQAVLLALVGAMLVGTKLETSPVPGLLATVVGLAVAAPLAVVVAFVLGGRSPHRPLAVVHGADASVVLDRAGRALSEAGRAHALKPLGLELAGGGVVRVSPMAGSTWIWKVWHDGPAETPGHAAVGQAVRANLRAFRQNGPTQFGLWTLVLGLAIIALGAWFAFM